MPGRSRARRLRMASCVALGACVLLITGCASRQTTFQTPEDAVRALLDSAKQGDTKELARILGPDSKAVIHSGDPVQDRNNRDVFITAAGEEWYLEDGPDGERELVVGHEQWPFPIPLVSDDGAWRFDTAAGIEEVLARRVGRNELTAIGMCETYVIAQNEYAASSHDGLPAGIYAQKITSTPGLQDGLYWDTAPNEDLSPLGPLAADAAVDGYTRSTTGKPRPFYGYYYRILTAQGDAAPTGARNYLVGSEMTSGFALIAHPAVYGQTGIMTFIVNQDGIVYQRDLGEDTTDLAAQITAFNPDDAWEPVQ